MARLAIAIDIGGTNIKTGVISSAGERKLFQKIPTHAEKGFGYTFTLIQGQIDSLIGQITEKSDICGIGCATAGQVDHIRGKVVFATDNLPGLSGFEMKQELETVFKLPVMVENDVNAAALGEHWLGAAKQFRDFICLTLGTGIGGAIFRNGTIDHGWGGISGEFGHMSIAYDGLPCNCGNKGCFEQYGSVSALINNLLRRIHDGAPSFIPDMVQGDLSRVNGELIFAAKEKGDRLAAEVIDEYIAYLATGIVNLVHILNPGAVVMGGGITNVGEALMQPLRQAVKAGAMPKFTENLAIIRSELGDYAGLYGAVKNLLTS